MLEPTSPKDISERIHMLEEESFSEQIIASEHLECARQLAIASGDVIKKYFCTALKIEGKADHTPVTVADREAEQAMREIVTETFPEHGFIGEELGEIRSEAEFVWVVDPIDGTKSFISGNFDFGTVIALLHKGQPILGVINQPILDHLVIGNNSRCTFNDEVIRMRDCPNLREAVLLATDLLNVGEFQPEKGFRELTSKVKFSRTWGNCYGYTLLSRGLADIFVDPIMSPWDLLGLIPIIRGAGGVITDYQGNDPVNGKSIVASNSELHDEVIRILNR